MGWFVTVFPLNQCGYICFKSNPMSKHTSTDRENIDKYLSADEQYSIENLLHRKPNEFELNMFAAMWSEHISYKSSARWIEDLPVEGEGVIVPAGEENAGVIRITDDLACIVKMESHNHPVALNPGEAAVGVGNVYRDLMAMGGKPVAQLNVLRFGDPNDPKVRESIGKIVRALGSYSNNFGVPVIGGEILFDESYTYNPLLNYLSLGLVKTDKVIRAAFRKKGDSVLLLGRKTSGAGVHGAGFASSPFTGPARHLIPETQLADPHAGKVLSECLQEMNEDGLILAMQDIGAGGVLCAASEMAFRGKTGVEIQIEDIPVIRKELSSIEILLSQSQEQMLVSVSPDKSDAFLEIAERWEITCAVIGKVTDQGSIDIKYGKEQLAHLPVSSLVKGGGAPVYIRNLEDPIRKVVRVEATEVPFPGNLKELARTMICHPNVASRRYIYEQFDTMAGLANVGSYFFTDAGLVALPDHDQLLAVSVDGNSRYVRREPRRGAMIAVAEAARNIVCSGGRPVALTNGLNFGDPSDLHVYYDFVESVKGIHKMASMMNVPVVAGNVSLNNQSVINGETLSVQPTPVIGMVGIVDSREALMSIGFRSKGDMIFLLGRSSNDISGSEYLAAVHLIDETASPEFDPEHELKLQKIMAYLAKNKLVASAHDVSIGGLFIALVECCLPNTLGFDITSPAEVREDAFLFGESQSRIIVSVSEDTETAFLDYMMEQEFPFSALGHVTKQEFRIDDQSFGFVTDYARDFENALGEVLEGS